MADAYDLLTLAHERAMAFLNSLPERPVAPGASFERARWKHSAVRSRKPHRTLSPSSAT